MGEQSTHDRNRVAETFAALRRSIGTERRRTAAERRAFESFANRVESVPCSHPDAGASPAGGMQNRQGAVVADAGGDSAGADPTDKIRRAYEETVMAVPFYDEEYGDDYVESLRAEFGPEVATALTDSDCFGPAATAALTAAIDHATHERDQLIAVCRRERESVDAAADTLLPVAAELDDISAIGPDGEPFVTLEARWRRLSRLQEYCEEAATDRQSTIGDRRSRHGLPVDAPDVCAYLYKSRDAAHPVLAICAGLAQRATEIKTGYERAMTRY